MKQITTCLLLLIFFAACQKTEITNLKEPENAMASAEKKGGGTTTITVTTSSVYVGSTVSASANGSVTGSGNVSERGFCYSTSPGPTINNDTARTGSGTGNFQRHITGLTIGTTYYIKAYAIKNGTVYYGNELNFRTLTLGMPSDGVGVVYDIDNNAYNTVRLGTQVWMIENLKTTRYRNGDFVENITGNTAWVNATSGAYCDYDNNPANSTAYGRLYNLYAVKDSRGLAPAGWHVPNYSEWTTLVNYLGGGDIGGGRMKETGLTHWLTPNTSADNSSLFTGLGGGGRNLFSSTGNFSLLQTRANIWSSSSSISATSTHLNIIFLYNNSATVNMTLGGFPLESATYGCSVRCLKD